MGFQWVWQITIAACIDNCQICEPSTRIPIHPFYPCHGADSRYSNLLPRRSLSLLQHCLPKIPGRAGRHHTHLISFFAIQWFEPCTILLLQPRSSAHHLPRQRALRDFCSQRFTVTSMCVDNPLTNHWQRSKLMMLTFACYPWSAAG